jgi:hypothetical protein
VVELPQPTAMALDLLKKRRRQPLTVGTRRRSDVQRGAVAQNNVGCHRLCLMGDHLTTTDVANLAAETHVRAARLARPSSIFKRWHERKFVDAIDDFTRALRSLPQREVEGANAALLADIGVQVDAIVEVVESFINKHGGGSLKRVERDRHLVTRIYELRASFEKLARGVTAQPGVTDLRWKVKMDNAHRKDS